MSAAVVATQMIIVFLFMVMGFGLAKKRILTDEGSKQISWIIVNIGSPALLISSAISEENTATMADVMQIACAAVIAFAVLIVLGLIMGRILHAPRDDWKYYNMMTVFSNLGFIGIPVASAVLGESCLIYCTCFNLIFNIIIYTYGIYILTKDEDGSLKGAGVRNMINSGTIACVAAMLLFALDIRLPVIAADALRYMGNIVTFMSVLVIGSSVAHFPLREIFINGRLYVFAVIRLLLLPIAFCLIMKIFIQDELKVGASLLMMAMPAANMPLMMAKQYDLDTDLLAKGITLTTILSVVTISVVSLFA